jgi:large subunit ribosomal protein L9
MEVILHKDVGGVGKAGSVVQVKEGFAMNYLLPQGLAVPSTPANLKKLEQEQEKKNQQLQKIQQEAEKLKERLSGVSLTISALTHDDDRLYGEVAAADIAKALKEEGFAIEKNAVVLEAPIKSLGIYEAAIKLHPVVTAKVKIWIVKK